MKFGKKDSEQSVYEFRENRCCEAHGGGGENQINFTRVPRIGTIFSMLKTNQHYVQISCTKFHPDQAVNMESGDSNSFTTLKHGFYCAHFHETLDSQINFVDIFSTESPK